jgi:hypothetical protein
VDKVEIFRLSGAWRFRTVGGELHPEAYTTPGAAYEAAGGQALESVEIIYPEDERNAEIQAEFAEAPAEPSDNGDGGEV